MLLMALLTAGASAADYGSLNRAGLGYGPNMSLNFMGNTPLVWGQWLPQAFGEVHYTWLEPMGELDYGHKPGAKDSYWRLDAAVEANPFIGGYKLGMGIRPFRSTIIFEANVTYESYLYFRSNVEMVTAEVEGSGEIARTWNADHITDNIWKKESAWDYAQFIDFGIHMGYAFERGSILGLNIHYILSDISTDFDGKSYDYELNMPVFSRDFMIAFELYGYVPLTKHLVMVGKSNYYRTGWLRNNNSIQKESLGYGLSTIGPLVTWSDGRQNLSLKVGGWRRIGDSFYNGSLSQQFLVQLEYQWYFSFPSRGNLSE